ncbi:MAG: PhoPQ-activated pathogenicity-related family protein [Planctomycetaceae bacterium]|jgi:PhoPQ-activated pathogenicity-related protein|nr:PhoPQ-activated pathogenicity-related family protein [Planctomycetaceae bacterium]
MMNLLGKMVTILLMTVLILFSGVLNAETPAPISATDPSPPDLDAYIAIPDSSFHWEVIEKVENNNENSYLLEMTSQTWHNIPWKHYLLIVIPNKLECTDHAALYITGKSIGNKPNDKDKLLARSLAEACGMPLGTLFQVPNQPLLGNFSEDALVGETFLKVMETKDTSWALLFPMAKSAIRALDAIQQSLKQEKQFDIQRFIVTGASKRGWTTWLAAATKDPRIVAIAPIVIDNLNIRQQMKYQVETWGDFSPSIHDYTDRNLVQMDEAEFSEFRERLWKMIDPYAYRTRLTLPKLLVHATNDPYWAVDATKNYWDDLLGVKYILTVPNAGHSLDQQLPKAIMSIAVFVRHAASGGSWYKMDWKLKEQESRYEVVLETEIPDYRTKLWTAVSETKDFRQAKWTSQPVENKNANPITIPKPASGHIAFYIEIESKAYGLPFSLTTQVWRF